MPGVQTQGDMRFPVVFLFIPTLRLLSGASMEKIIKIVKDGPYIVRGDIPIFEKVIAHENGEYVWKYVRELPQA